MKSRISDILLCYNESMIGILGNGSFGTALAQVLTDNGKEVFLWGRNEADIKEINTLHTHKKYFDCPISPRVVATTDFTRFNECEIILLAVPVKAMEEVLNRLSALLSHPVILVNVAKGFGPDNERLSVYIRRIMKEKASSVVSLIGPSHAEEVIERKITVINSVSEDEEAAQLIQHLFANEYFRVYRSSDVIGAEIASAVKNVMAIASGIVAGIGQGDNAKAALMTRGLAEMTRFALAFGAKKETFLGLNGVGDLIVTCSSIHSRNYQAGLAIGKANSAEDFLENNTRTTEGIHTAEAVHEMSLSMGIEMPISNAVYEVLYNHRVPSEIIQQLMLRTLKKEDI